MSDLTLFSLPDAGRARADDHHTSKAAAVATAERLPNRRDRIREAFREFDGLTDDELCALLQEPTRWWPSVKTARSALTAAGELVWSGEVRGRQKVWRRNGG